MFICYSFTDYLYDVTTQAYVQLGINALVKFINEWERLIKHNLGEGSSTRYFPGDATHNNLENLTMDSIQAGWSIHLILKKKVTSYKYKYII